MSHCSGGCIVEMVRHGGRGTGPPRRQRRPSQACRGFVRNGLPLRDVPWRRMGWHATVEQKDMPCSCRRGHGPGMHAMPPLVPRQLANSTITEAEG